MAVLDLFSYRQRIAKGDLPDVYIYDELPKELRVQIKYIWDDAMGSHHTYIRPEFKKEYVYNEAWDFIHDAVAREHGVLYLEGGSNTYERCVNYLLNTKSVNKVLDLIEFSFRNLGTISTSATTHARRNTIIRVTPEGAIKELNERFRRAGVGYRFEDEVILRVDSDLLHRDVVKPALLFLQQPGFNGPREEFLRAHGHYRAGEMKDAITNANNAFESTLKSICDQRSWQYHQGARASDLIRLVRSKGLLPNYLDNSFEQLIATLKSGLPKVRDEEGAHGQGASPRETPDYIAAYAIHLAAAKILFLAEAHKAMD